MVCQSLDFLYAVQAITKFGFYLSDSRAAQG